MPCAGLYGKLRDRSVCLNDKVKLVRYAWKHRHVNIVNKHQTLLHWLSAALTGKHRVEGSERAAIWQCLHDVLGSFSSLNTRVHVKPSLIQLLLDELNERVKGVGDIPSRGQLVSCFLAVLTTAGLNHHFSTRHESLMQLLVLVVKLCFQSLKTDGVIDTQTQQLLSTIVKKFISCYAMKTNAVQNFQQVSSKLLLPSLGLLEQLNLHGSPSDTVTEARDSITSFICRTLCARDLLQYYELYLRLKTPFIDASYSPPKFMEAFYSMLSSSVTSQERSSVMHFLPMFLDAFMTAYKPGENAVGFYQLVVLCEMVRGDVAGLQSLLDVALCHQVYNVTADINSGEKHIAWLKSLTHSLISAPAKQRNEASWYHCLETLVEISHMTVDGKLSTLFTACWLSAPQSVSRECEDSQASLLSKVVGVYARLRQCDRLIQSLLISLAEAESHLAWPTALLDSLASAFYSLPLTSFCNLWQLVLDKLPNLLSKPGCQAALELLSEALLSVQISESAMTQQTVSRMQERMASTRLNIIDKLCEGFSKLSSGEQFGVLYLALAWEQLSLAMSQMSQDKPGLINLTTAARSVKKSSHKPLQYIWKRIYICRLRIQDLYSNVDCDLQLWGEVQFLFDDLPLTNTHDNVTWNGKVVGVSEETYCTAYWCMVFEAMPVILGKLTNTHVKNICEVTCTQLSRDKTNMLQGLCSQFLSSPSFQESRVLHGVFQSCIWLEMEKTLSRKTEKKKSTLFQALGKRIPHESTSDEEMDADIVDMGKRINVVDIPDQEINVVTRILQVCLSNLPLEYMGVSDQGRCLVGVVTLMVSLDMYEGHLPLCVGLLSRLLESPHSLKLLHIINASEFICILMPHLSQNVSGLKDLLNKVIRLLCKEWKLLEQLEPLVTQLCQMKVKKRKDVNTFKCMMLLFRTFIKVQFRSKGQDDRITKTCEAYVSRMTPTVRRLVPVLLQEASINADICLETMATLLMLNKPEDESEVLTELPSVCSLCIQRLNGSSDVGSCIDFIIKICKYKDSLALEDSIYEDILKAVMKHLCEAPHNDDPQVKDTVALLLATLPTQKVQLSLQLMLSSLRVGEGEKWIRNALVTLDIWRHLLTAALPEHTLQSYLLYTQQLMRNLQEVMLMLHNRVPSPMMCELQTTSLRVQAHILTRCVGMLPGQTVIQPLHSCQYVCLDDDVTYALPLMSAVYEVLNALILCHPLVVTASVPSFLSTVLRLLRSLMKHSQQDVLMGEDQRVEALMVCVQQIDRLFSKVKLHQSEFARVAPYAIAEFVQGLQKATILPEIKKSLSLAMHNWLSMCDEHSLALLQTTLPAGHKEIFSILYQQYKKYYKYTGRV